MADPHRSSDAQLRAIHAQHIQAHIGPGPGPSDPATASITDADPDARKGGMYLMRTDYDEIAIAAIEQEYERGEYATWTPTPRPRPAAGPGKSRRR